MNLSPARLRALRNAVIAFVATAVVGFTALSVFGNGGGSENGAAPTSPITTPSAPPIVCGNAFETVPSADPSNKGDALYGVAALASDDAWVVGNAGPRDTLIEHWDGTSWAPVDSPNGNLRRNALYGVAGLAPTDVWAVGSSSLGLRSEALIEHWDGFAWNIVQGPGDLPPGSTLSAVTAVTPDDVWAVGGSGDTLNGRGDALILHWNGQLWSIIPGATLAAGGSFLSDVAAADGGSQVWALGYGFADTASTTLSEPVIERWDGTAWISVPNAGVPGDSLHALGIGGLDQIWAAGNPIQLWSGQAWTAVRSPQADLADIFDIAAVEAEDAWAVGSLSLPQTGIAAGARASIVHWDGQRWSVVDVPRSKDQSQTLTATAAFAGGGVWAAGSRVAADGSERTLIMRRSCGTAPAT
jgi:hypothetical protein